MDTSRDRMGEPGGRTSDQVGWAERFGEEAGRVAEEAGRVRDLAAARARGFVTSAREHAAGYVQEAVQHTREKVAELTEGGFERLHNDVVAYTRQQPVRALLVAAGVGLILGWLTARGRQ
jgi:ElaB/YqjD/DUF883 family membrane-anchored ribosome-binding protein